jgi:ABC-type oligopeptide transport system ATPase subunit
MAVATEAITVRQLSKTYATRDGAVTALDRTTFGIAEGEFVAVVGPSGCGTLKYGIIKDKISAKDLVTNDLIDAINRFDASKVAAEAKAYK